MSTRKPVWQQWAEKAAMGFAMGAAAGMTVGLLHGGFTVLRHGPAPGKTYLGTVATSMVASGGMLGFILGFGSLVRTEPLAAYPLAHSFYTRTHGTDENTL